MPLTCLYTAADYVVPFNNDDTNIFLWNLTQVLTDHVLDSILTNQVRAHKSLYADIDKKNPIAIIPLIIYTLLPGQPLNSVPAESRVYVSKEIKNGNKPNFH